MAKATKKSTYTNSKKAAALKKKIAPAAAAAADTESEEEEEEYEVESILKHRNKNGVKEYKIRWKGFGSAGDTWEPEEHLDGAQDKLHNYLEKQFSKKSATGESSSSSRVPAKRKGSNVEEKVKKSLIPNDSDSEDEAETYPSGINFKKNLNKSDWDNIITQVKEYEETPFGEKYFVVWKDGDEGWIDSSYMEERAPQNVITYFKFMYKNAR